MVRRASFSWKSALYIVLLGDDMYSCIHIIDIRCTISFTVMFIMLCNTVQATFNVTPCIVHT